MKTRQTLLFGLAGLGFVLAGQAQALGNRDMEEVTSSKLFAAENRQGSFVVARRDESEMRFQPKRDPREAKPVRQQSSREAEHPAESPGYGYGYERRQQPPPARDEYERARKP